MKYIFKAGDVVFVRELRDVHATSYLAVLRCDTVKLPLSQQFFPGNRVSVTTLRSYRNGDRGSHHVTLSNLYRAIWTFTGYARGGP
jgi:hypothetical protein